MKTQKYEHVIVVGIDGAGSFIKDADTPNFDRIFANGAITFDALASNPSISAECWGSMLTGVGPELHKLVNPILKLQKYPLDSPFPTLFRRIREAIPDAEMGSYCHWRRIIDGMLEEGMEVSTETAPDTDLTPIICEYIRNKKPTFLFTQFDSIDHVGHQEGYGTPAFMKRVNEVDSLVNDVYSAIEDAGILDETLFIVIADHGGTNLETGGGTHGGWTDEEKYVTLAIAGKGVVKGRIPAANVRDLAAIVLYALGIEAPAFDEAGWTSQVPMNVFHDPDIPEYRDISHLAGAAPRISKTPHTSELI